MRVTASIWLGVLLATTGSCAAQVQVAVPEWHASDLMAQQPQSFIAASALCNEARASGHSIEHDLKTDMEKLEPGLATLMEKSDEVILVGHSFSEMKAISPSGKDVATYYDVKVLRTWKGTHKVGTTTTFAIPAAIISCDSVYLPLPWIETLPDAKEWYGFPWGPKILFLRQSKGAEAAFLPGYRLTGGDGLQGAFIIPYPLQDGSCVGVARSDHDACLKRLETSQTAILDPYRADPLMKSYDEMPAADFLKEVDSIAASLGYPAPVDSLPEKKAASH